MWDAFSRANWVDAIIVILMAIGIMRGLKTGLVSQILMLISMVIGIRLAFQTCSYLAQLVEPYIPLAKEVRIIISFVAIYLLIALACRLVIFIWRDLTAETAVSWLDSFGGGVMGGLRVLVISTVVLYLLSHLPLGLVSKPASSSILMEITNPFTDQVWEKLPQLKQRLEDTQVPQQPV